MRNHENACGSKLFTDTINCTLSCVCDTANAITFDQMRRAADYGMYILSLLGPKKYRDANPSLTKTECRFVYFGGLSNIQTNWLLVCQFWILPTVSSILTCVLVSWVFVHASNILTFGLSNLGNYKVAKLRTFGLTVLGRFHISNTDS